MHIYGNAVTNSRKKYFRTQNSDKTAGFGSEIAWIRQIQNAGTHLQIKLAPSAGLFEAIVDTKSSCFRREKQFHFSVLYFLPEIAVHFRFLLILYLIRVAITCGEDFDSTKRGIDSIICAIE